MKSLNNFHFNFWFSRLKDIFLKGSFENFYLNFEMKQKMVTISLYSVAKNQVGKRYSRITGQKYLTEQIFRNGFLNMISWNKFSQMTKIHGLCDLYNRISILMIRLKFSEMKTCNQKLFMWLMWSVYYWRAYLIYSTNPFYEN